MLAPTLRAKLARATALTATAAVAAASLVAGAPSAGADPKQIDAFVTTGSDTTQDILNALAGNANGNNFSPLQSVGGQKQVVSFDAVPPVGSGDNCITTKIKSATMFRPNGSSAGRRALSRAIDGTGWGPTTQCGGTKDISGLVDFARSSAGPTSGDTGTALTYIPFGRDGMSFGYYRASGGAAVDTLSRAQITSLFTTGPQVVNGVRIVPCGIQTGSGTYQFWNTVTTASASQDAAATAECNNLLGVPSADGRVQENAADQLKIKGDAVPAGNQVIVGFSAANFISQSNGVAASQLATGVDLGSISDNGGGVNLGKPYVGTAPNTTPSSTFYADGTFGRTVYNVFSTALIDSAFGNNDLKSLFKGTTAALCQTAAQTTVNRFGFTTPTNCGNSALKGSLLSGIQ